MADDAVKKLAEELEVLRVRVKEQDAALKEKVSSEERKPVMLLPGQKIEKFRDTPEQAGGVTIREWATDMRSQAAARMLSGPEFATFILTNLGGKARQEILGREESLRKDPEKILDVLLSVFGDDDRLSVLQQRFFSYKQTTEDMLTCSLELVDLYDRIIEKDPTFAACRESTLKGRLPEIVKDENLCRELSRLNDELPNLSFFELRDRAIRWVGRSAKSSRSVSCQEAAVVDPVLKAIEAQGQQIQQQQRQIDELTQSLKESRNNWKPGRRCWHCHSLDHIKAKCPKLTHLKE